MRSQAPPPMRLVEAPPDRLTCAACARAVESDVLGRDELLRVLGWASVDGRVLCVTCREDAGRPAELIRRVLARS